MCLHVYTDPDKPHPFPVVGPPLFYSPDTIGCFQYPHPMVLPLPPQQMISDAYHPSFPQKPQPNVLPPPPRGMIPLPMVNAYGAGMYTYVHVHVRIVSTVKFSCRLTYFCLTSSGYKYLITCVITNTVACPLLYSFLLYM